jgi:anti-sigma28 factor (negative regulator of flagellin synthesis)
MDICRSRRGLQLLGGMSSPGMTGQQTKRGRARGGSALAHGPATFTSSGGKISLTVDDSGVRMDKVSAVRSALWEGKYSVPASEVASRVMESMFSERR